MNLSLNARPRRRAVFTVLAAWLFALSAGWVNACLLQQLTTHAHGGSDSASQPTRGAAVSAGHAGAVAAHDAQAGASEAPCLKVCADGSQSLVRAPSVFDPVDPGPAAPPVALAWVSQAPLASRHDSTSEAPYPIAGPPLRVRYSRLAL
jgi:hypothetical protein